MLVNGRKCGGNYFGVVLCSSYALDIARGSAMECRATIDVCHILGLVSDVKKTQTKELLHRIVAMLTKLSRI